MMKSGDICKLCDRKYGRHYFIDMNIVEPNFLINIMRKREQMQDVNPQLP